MLHGKNICTLLMDSLFRSLDATYMDDLCKKGLTYILLHHDYFYFGHFARMISYMVRWFNMYFKFVVGQTPSGISLPFSDIQSIFTRNLSPTGFHGGFYR